MIWAFLLISVVVINSTLAASTVNPFGAEQYCGGGKYCENGAHCCTSNSCCPNTHYCCKKDGMIICCTNPGQYEP
uniref:Cysteine rich secreted protein n=1 Tax=Riptortus pedestris TaxID=329032 RepID=R4WCM3_RIPPE|nr:cysteine rich secreted protein [Riptortus pedestris]